MKKMIWTASAVLAAAVPAAVWAQAVPNYGNYQSRDENFRIGIRLTNTGGATLDGAFAQNTIDDIITYLDPAEIAAAQPGFYNAQTQVQGVFDLRGAPVLAGYAPNSPTLTVQFIDTRTGGTLIGPDGLACSFTYAGATRGASFDQFDAATDSDLTPDERLLGCLGNAWARSSPVDPLVGNPYSLQGNMTRNALDFTDGMSLVELGPNANSAGDPFIIGATFSTGSAGRFDMTRIDARINKGWRLLEGNRARLKLDIPFSFTTIKGAAAYTGEIGLGLEVPIMANFWSLEPRVAYGVTYSGEQGSLGHIVQGTIASRLVFRGLGRGQLMVGNMAGYSTTLDTPGDLNINPDVKAWMFRNGFAYELPLKMRVGGRNTSFRASYGFTNYTGAVLYNNNFHEASVSFGLRGREDTPKAFRDVVRLNFNTIQAKGFSTYTVGLGFRF